MRGRIILKSLDIGVLSFKVFSRPGTLGSRKMFRVVHGTLRIKSLYERGHHHYPDTTTTSHDPVPLPIEVILVFLSSFSRG